MNEIQQQEQDLKERIRELEAENARLKQLILKLKGQRSAANGNMSTMLREALRE
jgi:uncharacterized small protein (DUF1192 family)